MRIVRSFGQEPRHAGGDGRPQRGQPRRQHDDGLPQRHLLPVGRIPLGGRRRRRSSSTAARRRSTTRSRSALMVAFIGYLSRSSSNRSSELSPALTTYRRGWRRSTRSSTARHRAGHDRPPDAIDPGPIRGEIDLKGVWFTYKEDPAARTRERGSEASGNHQRDRAGAEQPQAEPFSWAVDVDLHVPPGQTLALVGATGAGKSTLAKLVARFYDPQRGSVLVDGHDLLRSAPAGARRQLGIVPQEGYLFSGSVRENIAFGRPDATLEEIGRRSRRGRRGAFIAALPEGIETEVSERGAHALRRAAPARRLRPRAAGGAADPDPRRGDVERRRPHREDDRAAASSACSPAARRSSSPTASRRSAAPARSSSSTAAGSPRRHPRRADRGRRRLRPPLRRLGRVLRGLAPGRLTGADAAGAGGRHPLRRHRRSRHRRLRCCRRPRFRFPAPELLPTASGAASASSSTGPSSTPPASGSAPPSAPEVPVPEDGVGALGASEHFSKPYSSAAVWNEESAVEASVSAVSRASDSPRAAARAALLWA